MSQDTLGFAPQGEAAVMVYLGREIDLALNGLVHALTRRLRDDAPAWLKEVLPGYASLQVQFDALATDHGEVEAWVRSRAAGLTAAPAEAGRVVEIPTVYGGEHGPDLEFVARRAGLDPAEVIARHAARDYHCYLLGFTPGFPFLGGLDPELATPRLESPRPEVPVGAVGIAGTQTGLYPLGGPGGWQLIGRTTLLTYDPRRQPASLFQAGDRLRFVPVDTADFPEPPDQPAPWGDEGRPVLEVIQPGASTLVQDGGRWGCQDQGVPVCGALDRASLAVANRLVGNPAGAAALELTLMGPKLRVLAPCRVAICGADLNPRLDGQPLALNRAHDLTPGQVLAFAGPKNGSRAVLAVAGGLAAREIMGSRSVYPLGRLGGALGAKQVIRVGQAAPEAPDWTPDPDRLPQPARSLVLRVVPGPNQEHFSPEGMATFLGQEYRVGPQSDRRGMRLEGPAIALDPASPGSIISEPVAPGSVQVPAGGQPIVLFREQTVGGYCKIATVIGPDLDRLARALPGCVVRFQAVDAARAVAIARQEARDLTTG